MRSLDAVQGVASAAGRERLFVAVGEFEHTEIDDRLDGVHEREAVRRGVVIEVETIDFRGAVTDLREQHGERGARSGRFATGEHEKQQRVPLRVERPTRAHTETAGTVAGSGLTKQSHRTVVLGNDLPAELVTEHVSKLTPVTAGFRGRIAGDESAAHESACCESNIFSRHDTAAFRRALIAAVSISTMSSGP